MLTASELRLRLPEDVRRRYPRRAWVACLEYATRRLTLEPRQPAPTRSNSSSSAPSPTRAEAERAFRRAAETPAIFPEVQAQALYGAAAACAEQWVENRNSPEVADILARGVSYTRRRLELGPLRPSQAYMLARVARRANELELSRDVLENTLNKNPGNVMLLQEQARIELETGDFQRWIQTADEALQHKPDADQAKEVPSLRSQAVEKLRAFVEGQK